MTAQIAVLNKHAIALASDSAVTVSNASKRKIYNSANKLFTLSKFAPIGIMIFGNAEFVSIPWETIIKEYRLFLRDKTFDSIDGYKDDFLSFLKNASWLFSDELKKDSIFNDSISLLLEIREQFTSKLGQAIEKNGKITEKEIFCCFAEQIRLDYKFIKNQALLESVNKETIKSLCKNYKDMLDDAINVVFQKFPISPMLKARLIFLVLSFHCRDCFSDSQSGVVIAGFGEKEIFPKVRSLVFQGFYGSFLKCKLDSTSDISNSNGAAIIPFAQKETVREFMEGIHPIQKRNQTDFVSSLLMQLPNSIVDNLPKLSDDEKQIVKSNLSNAFLKIEQEFKEKQNNFTREKFISPVVDTVSSLPKEELATMAEALVNLTQFRQKITMELETVGGPIDVAVISKGDGFIWINRKHYFKKEFNPYFFQKYFLIGEGSDDKNEQ